MTTPAILYAEHTDERRQRWSVALVRTRWSHEGQLVIERTTTDDGIDMVEQGGWFCRSSDLSAATLAVGIPGLEDDVDAAVVNELLAKLVAIGGSWGFEAYEALS